MCDESLSYVSPSLITSGAVGKNSLKGHVRFLQVSRLSGSSYAGLLSMLVLTKEKKAKSK